MNDAFPAAFPISFSYKHIVRISHDKSLALSNAQQTPSLPHLPQLNAPIHWFFSLSKHFSNSLNVPRHSFRSFGQHSPGFLVHYRADVLRMSCHENREQNIYTSYINKFSGRWSCPISAHSFVTTKPIGGEAPHSMCWLDGKISDW